MSFELLRTIEKPEIKIIAAKGSTYLTKFLLIKISLDFDACLVIEKIKTTRPAMDNNILVETGTYLNCTGYR
jgi:hypothetical protein